MAVRTSKGTVGGKSVDTLTIAGVTVQAGASLLVDLGYAAGPLLLSATWNGHALATDLQFAPAGIAARALAYHNAAGGTGDIVITLDGAADWMVVAAVEWVGYSLTPKDKTAQANGSSTTPSSGATAATTQAVEVARGFVVTNGPVEDAAGAWGNSWTAGQRDGTTGGAAGTNGTLSSGHLVLAATGAQTASKSGITSRAWVALCVTYKAEAAVAVTLAGAAAFGGTARPVATSVVLGNEATAAQVAGGALPAALTEQQQQNVYSSGMTSAGAAYFAAWMQNLANFPYIPGAEDPDMNLYVALNAPPIQLADPDEPHWLFSLHEVGGIELWSIGVTPSLRLCMAAYQMPTLFSAPGIIAADGRARQITASGFLGSGATRILSLDGVQVAQDQRSYSSFPTTFASPTGKPVRIMFFNGVEARSRVPCTIFFATIAVSDKAVAWPFDDPLGQRSRGGEPETGTDPRTLFVPSTAPDMPGIDWTVTAGAFDPAPYPPVWAAAGGPPIGVGTPTTRYTRAQIAATRYTRLSGNPPSPAGSGTFTPHPPGGPGFSPFPPGPGTFTPAPPPEKIT